MPRPIACAPPGYAQVHRNELANPPSLCNSAASPRSPRCRPAPHPDSLAATRLPAITPRRVPLCNNCTIFCNPVAAAAAAENRTDRGPDPSPAKGTRGQGGAPVHAAAPCTAHPPAKRPSALQPRLCACAPPPPPPLPPEVCSGPDKAGCRPRTSGALPPAGPRCTRPRAGRQPPETPAPSSRMRTPRPPHTCNSSLTRSMGATAVLEMAAATPPARKSLAKEMACSVMAARGAGGAERAERRRGREPGVWAPLAQRCSRRRDRKDGARSAQPLRRPDAPPRAPARPSYWPPRPPRPRPLQGPAPPRVSGSRARPRPTSPGAALIGCAGDVSRAAPRGMLGSGGTPRRRASRGWGRSEAVVTLSRSRAAPTTPDRRRRGGEGRARPRRTPLQPGAPGRSCDRGVQSQRCPGPCSANPPEAPTPAPRGPALQAPLASCP